MQCSVIIIILFIPKMEKKVYTSCIKINGVPILPPMMTDSIREEMKHYRYLAVAFEERLKTMQSIELRSKMNFSDSVNEEYKSESKVGVCNSDVDESIVSNSDTDSTPTVPNVETVIYIPICDAESRQSYSSQSIEMEHSNVGDDEHSVNNTVSNLKSRILNNKYDASKPFHKGLEASNIPEIKAHTMETTSDTWKPEVPKTLDIIPIVLDSPNKVTNDDATMSNENGDMPKLMRQGSYVLDAPSPMLLAHLQTEMMGADNISNSNYIPTPSTASRRKEWSITERKIEWENKVKNTEKIGDTLKMLDDQSIWKGMNPAGEQKVGKKSLSQEMHSDQSYRAGQSAKSVDCIQAMLAKEYISKSINSDEKIRALSKWKINRSVSGLNMANKFGGSLGSLENNVVGQWDTYKERKNSRKGRIEDEVEEKVAKLDEVDLLISDKLQWSITSGKLLDVFKEIEEMHKKQMIDLVVRQQKEQSLLQKEFEKQQTRVLMEIRKAFPEISAQEVCKNFKNSFILEEKNLTPTSNGQRTESFNDGDGSLDDNLTSVSDSNGRRESFEMRTTNHVQSPCPLDYIHVKRNVECRLQQGRCQSTQTQTNLCKPIANGGTEDLISCECNSLHSYERENHKLIDTMENKLSNVSRQLFPLDTKTVHLPVLDRFPTYTEKHVRAATLINAYVKGYLVRRMMRTERIISLKNTYKEAIICTLKLHADAPLKLSELNFLRRLELQCDAASMNIVELFAQSPAKRMQVIAHDREIKRSRTTERPSSARSYSFATQRTLARKRLKEMGSYQLPGIVTRPCSARSRCQTWTSDNRDKPNSPNLLYHSIKRSTSAGTVRKPWR